MIKVKIYSTKSCPWCQKAKEYFKEKKIKFTDVNVAEDNQARDEMIEKSGQMGVPVIEIGDKVIVGFNLEKIEKALKK
ncbi:MAG: glutaredoxin domain-containing protein [Nanoarchaeota archaeon]|nr:glutathione S-transferase N-terminal domain-containing protein [Nanoarchaeota archaeon]MBU1631637.1 glutathione S-transferase N-terminal domain-containing protein [Nanoarchaeota archaeon]MBU1875650.1 glutathione S-transferase N-terminal domain-containing protein [Nanoarchaeota archaeon]